MSGLRLRGQDEGMKIRAPGRGVDGGTNEGCGSVELALGLGLDGGSYLSGALGLVRRKDKCQPYAGVDERRVEARVSSPSVGASLREHRPSRQRYPK